MFVFVIRYAHEVVPACNQREFPESLSTIRQEHCGGQAAALPCRVYKWLVSMRHADYRFMSLGSLGTYEQHRQQLAIDILLVVIIRVLKASEAV